MTRILLPALRVREFPAPEEIVPAPLNAIDVGVMAMVSREDTPVKLPLVVTFNPPLEIRANVPVVLPIVTLFVPVPKDTAPLPVAINIPEN